MFVAAAGCKKPAPPIARPTPPPVATEAADANRRPLRRRRSRNPGPCRPSRSPRTRSPGATSATSTRTRRSSRCSSPWTAPRSMQGAAGAQCQRRDHEEIPDLGDLRRRARRRARHGGIQSGARGEAGDVGPHLSRLARHFRDRLRTVSYGKEFPFDPATTRPPGRKTAGRSSCLRASRNRAFEEK